MYRRLQVVVRVVDTVNHLVAVGVAAADQLLVEASKHLVVLLLLAKVYLRLVGKAVTDPFLLVAVLLNVAEVGELHLLQGTGKVDEDFFQLLLRLVVQRSSGRSTGKRRLEAAGLGGGMLCQHFVENLGGEAELARIHFINYLS